MLKTRLELLEGSFYVGTLGKVLESEINLRAKRRKAIVAKPNDLNYQQIQKEVSDLQTAVTDYGELLSIILELIEEERSKNGKKV